MRPASTTISCVTGAAVCALLMSRVVGTQPAALGFPLQLLWSVTLPSPPVFRPAYDRVHAYVPLRNGRLTAVNLNDGQVAWSVDVVASAAPAAGDDLVFVGTKDLLEARSAGNGTVQWRIPLEGSLSAPLVWDTGWLIAGTEHSEVLALRGADGEILWRRSFGSTMRTAPAPADGRLYVSLADGHVVALTLQTGELVWTAHLRQPATDILALDDRLFVGSKDNYVYSLATGNGGVGWRWRTGGDIVGTPVVDLERLYFVSLDNEIRALDRWNGALRWQRPMPIRPSAGPLRIGETLIVAGVSAKLRAYHARDGSPAGEFAVESPGGEELQFAAPPHLVETPSAALVILTRNGLLQRLGPSAPPP